MLIAAKILLTLTILGYALITIKADFNKTHATNPRWTPHARFHVVWQILSYAGVGLVALCLVWIDGPQPLERLDLRRLLHQRLQPSAIRRLALRRQWLPAVQAAGRPAKLALGRQRHRVYGSIRHYAGRRRRGTSGVAVPPLWGGISYLFTFGTSMPSAVARSIW